MSQNQTIICAIANALCARHNCVIHGNKDWAVKWNERLKQLEDLLPRGSGVDSGTHIIVDASRDPMSEVKFTMDFHHMDEHGSYDGWTEHVVTVRPTFHSDHGLSLSFTGRDRNQIKNYLDGILRHALSEPAPEVPWAKEESK